jgi:hypothetical protein
MSDTSASSVAMAFFSAFFSAFFPPALPFFVGPFEGEGCAPLFLVILWLPCCILLLLLVLSLVSVSVYILLSITFFNLASFKPPTVSITSIETLVDVLAGWLSRMLLDSSAIFELALSAFASTFPLPVAMYQQFQTDNGSYKHKMPKIFLLPSGKLVTNEEPILIHVKDFTKNSMQKNL